MSTLQLIADDGLSHDSNRPDGLCCGAETQALQVCYVVSYRTMRVPCRNP